MRSKIQKKDYLKISMIILILFLLFISFTSAITVKIDNTSVGDLADISYGTSNVYYTGFQIKFNISSIPEGQVINDAIFCGYMVPINGEYTDNDARLWRIEEQTWNESSSLSIIQNQSLTNQTDGVFSELKENTWACINVTNIIRTDYILSNNYSSIRVEDPDRLVPSVEFVNDDSSLFAGDVANHPYFNFDDRENTAGSGNSPYLNITYEVGVDTNPPMIIINSPLNQSYYNSEIILNITATDYNGVDECYYSLDGALNISLSQKGNYYSNVNSTMTSGSHAVTFYCNDTIGNLHSGESIIFDIHTTPPAIIINSPTSQINNATEILFNITATDADNISVCSYSIDSGNNITLKREKKSKFIIPSGSWGLLANNGAPTGMDTDGTYVWVADIGNYVYKYYINGTYISRFSTDAPGRTNLVGVTTDGAYLWTIDAGTSIVYKYSLAGIYLDSFDASENNGAWMRGITTDGEYFWIVDQKNDEVYKYYINGTYANESFYTGFSGNTHPFGITTDDNFIWVINNDAQSEEGKSIYKYYLNGTYTGENFSILNSNTDPRGIASIGLKILVSNNHFDIINKYEVYEYTNNYIYTNYSMPDAIYLLNVFCNDTFNNKNSSSVTFIVDTIYPLINYSNGVENNFVNKSQNWIFINTSVVETNEKNITFYLYNSTNLINATTYNKIHSINFTNLLNGIYYYNVTIYDISNHINFTNTRQITLDYINPNNTLIAPINNKYLNLSLNNFTSNLIDNLGLKNAIIYIYNLTGLVNQTTITFLDHPLNYSWSIAVNLVDNMYKWCVESFDIVGNSEITENNTFIVDTKSPNIFITTISTVDNYQTFNFASAVLDANLDVCYYTIYNDGDGIDGSNENVSFECNNITQATTTSFGDFILKIYAKDKVNHTSSTSQPFTTRYVNVDVGGGSGGGGGGGTTVIVIGDEEVKWTVSTLSGGEKYQLDMFKGIDRSNVLNFENVGDKDVNIQLSCKDISISDNFCEFVSFSEDSFSLPMATDVVVPITVTISNVSKNLPKKTYTFNIVSTDDDNNRGVITYVVNYGSKNIIIKIITKMGSKFRIGDIDLPYWLLFIFISSILITLLNFTIIKKFKLPTALSFIIGIILGVVIILFI